MALKPLLIEALMVGNAHSTTWKKMRNKCQIILRHDASTVPYTSIRVGNINLRKVRGKKPKEKCEPSYLNSIFKLDVQC